MFKLFMTISVLSLAGGMAFAGPELDEPVPGEAVVRVLEGVDIADFIAAFEADHADLGVTLGVSDAIASRGIFQLSFDAEPLTDPELEALETAFEDGYPTMLRWGEFDYVAEAPEGRTGTFWLSIEPQLGESSYNGQFSNALLELPQTHVVSTGAGTVVAVLDTGLDATHRQLAGRIVPGGFNFIDGNGNVDDVGDGLDSDGDGVVDEQVGHGTFVASLVALTAPGAGILPVRVLDSDGTTTNWIVAKGIFHAIDQGVEVINMSLGSTYKAAAIEDALGEAELLGIVAIGAAGNLNRSEPEEFPALDNEAFGVAAADDQDVKAAFSNYNEGLTLTAPGASISMPGNPDVPDLARSIIGAIPGNEYAAWEGTSFATAFVAGAAALIRAQHPEWPTPAVPGYDITEQIESVLVWSAVDIDALNDPALAGMLGAGRLAPAAAVALGPPMPALGDLDADGRVATADVLTLLAGWGLVHSSADLDGDGVVGAPDLLILLSAWTG